MVKAVTHNIPVPRTDVSHHDKTLHQRYACMQFSSMYCPFFLAFIYLANPHVWVSN